MNVLPDQLKAVLNGSSDSIYIENFYPQYLRVPRSGDVHTLEASNVSAWQSRGGLPVAVEITTELISIQQRDPYTKTRELVDLIIAVETSSSCREEHLHQQEQKRCSHSQREGLVCRHVALACYVFPNHLIRLQQHHRFAGMLHWLVTSFQTISSACSSTIDFKSVHHAV